uniref:Sulfotransferase domain-containing protein n=1 Tax=Ditylum brightwellii TaxID=49249 RepID=A0A7S4VMF6_9STRA
MDRPKKIQKNARYIYMIRRPDDACVSFYHHLSHQSIEDGGYSGSFDDFVHDFTHAGNMPYGTWSAHIKSWMKCSEDERVLVLSYEDLKKDLKGSVQKVNKHCGFGLSEDRVEELVPQFTFDWMRKNEGFFHPRSVRWVRKEDEGEDFHFIRKGQVGDGKKLFSSQHFDQLRFMINQTFPKEGEGLPTFILPFLDGIL